VAPSRTFGWVQDAADFKKLRDVVQLFSNIGNSKQVARLDTIINLDPQTWTTLRTRLNQPGFQATHKELIGSDKKLNGLIPALLPGQKKDSHMRAWPSSAFLFWAHALGLLKYNRGQDSYCLTDLGSSLLATTPDSKEETSVFVTGVSSYPPAVRVLTVLNSADRAFTKYEVGEQLGFLGEAGFTSFAQAIIVAAVNAGDAKKSDAEGTADKYARMICGWLVKLGLATAGKSTRTGMSQTEYTIAYPGKALLTKVQGKSKHPAVPQRIYWEMLATKGSDRDYLRNYRLEILRQLSARAKQVELTALHAALVGKGFAESEITLTANLRGLQRIGIRLEERSGGWCLSGPINLDAPAAVVVVAPTIEYAGIEDLRALLIKTPEKYLTLVALSVSGKETGKSREFEVLLMDYLVNALGLPGRLLGGGSKPDGVVHVNTKGVVVDAKSYSGGYPLNTKDQDSMVRYVQECRGRLPKSGNASTWWTVFPVTINDYTYSFVSGSFKSSVTAGLADIANRLDGTRGTALSVRELLETGEKFLTEETSLAERIDALFYEPVGA
jgi:hypothetical protein